MVLYFKVKKLTAITIQITAEALYQDDQSTVEYKISPQEVVNKF